MSANVLRDKGHGKGLLGTATAHPEVHDCIVDVGGVMVGHKILPSEPSPLGVLALVGVGVQEGASRVEESCSMAVRAARMPVSSICWWSSG
jgi:hypothetical protein